MSCGLPSVSPFPPLTATTFTVGLRSFPSAVKYTPEIARVPLLFRVRPLGEMPVICGDVPYSVQ
jgi:hypothetical protein